MPATPKAIPQEPATMSSTAVLGFIKDISAKNLKAVQERLKSAAAGANSTAQTANQRFVDPKQQGLTYTLLHKAVEVCSLEITSALLTAGADVNTPDSKGRTPLHWLATSSSDDKALEVAELLLQQPGINMNSLSSSEATPLHEAAAHGNTRMLQLLLKHGAQPLNSSPGFNALHAACMGSCSKPPAQVVPAAPSYAATSTDPVLQPAEEPCQPQDAAAQQQQQQEHERFAAQQAGPAQAPAPAAPAASSSKPGQLKSLKAPPPPAAAAASRAGKAAQAPHPPQQPKPTAGAPLGRSAVAATGRVGALKPSSAAPSKATTVAAARPGGSTATGSKLTSKAAANAAGPGAANAAATAAAAAAADSVAAGVAGASAARASAAAVTQPGVSKELLGLLLAAAPQLLQEQDAEGFTPLMRLVQRGRRADVELLLAAGDCNIHAQANATGDTALHLACSSAKPDLQLVAVLVAAGADPMQARSCDGSTPLIMAAKAGGQAGLAMAQALLPPGRTLQQQQQQQRKEQPPQQRATGTLWCSLDAADDGKGTSSGGSQGAHAANTAAVETAASIAAAAVLADISTTTEAGAATGQAAGPPAAAAVSGGKSEQARAQQELLVLLLDVQAQQLPQHLAVSLLQQGLQGRLPDKLTAKVLGCIQDISSLQAAEAPPQRGSAAAAAPVMMPSLSFSGLMGAKMYRTAVAWLCKSSGKAAAADVDAAGNTLLHRAVAQGEDLPDYVSALVEAGVPLDAANHDNDTAAHLAARQGHLESCRALVAAGADLLRRNGKNRIPGTQLKLSEPVKAFLQQAEEDFRAAKEEQQHVLWDGKMRATQTQSAFGIRVT